MSIRDAANLLIALAGTGVTREAGDTVERFRNLRGRAFLFVETLSGHFRECLAPLKLRASKGRALESFRLAADFGTVLEFFIASCLDGRLASTFARIPVAEIPGDLWAEWQRQESQYLEQSLDRLIQEGLVQTKPSNTLRFGEDISLEFKFSRLNTAVEIEFRRMWDAPQTVLALVFGSPLGAQDRGPHVLRIEATVTQHLLAALGMLVQGAATKSRIINGKAAEELFARQFDAFEEATDARP
jgi:hypothetical protein